MNSDIRLSVGFWQHPKTKKTVKRLGLEGIRSVQILWLWAAVNRPTGVLSGMDWEDIELAADWQGEERLFFDSCLAMWIDETPDGYALHDWEEHNTWAAGAEDRSGQSRLSKLAQVNREAYDYCVAQGITSLTPKEYLNFKQGILATPQRPQSGATATPQRSQSGRRAKAERTPAKPTGPAPSPSQELEEEDIRTPPSPPGGCGAVDASASTGALEGGRDAPSVTDPADVDIGFHEFMAAYPPNHRAPEAEAAAVWKKLSREKKLPGLTRLFQGLDAWENSHAWRKDGGEFIPKAANFLRRMMWQDEPPKQPRASPHAPTPYQQGIADKDDMARTILAEQGIHMPEETHHAGDHIAQVGHTGHRVRDAAHQGTACITGR